MTTAPEFQSFPVVSGDQIQLEFTVIDRNDAIVDLTAGSGRFAMARNVYDTTLVIDSDASPATATVSIVDPLNGRVDVIMTDETTDALVGDYYWEFRWTDILGREAMAARGIMSFAENLI
jgi:hypothetical protein